MNVTRHVIIVYIRDEMEMLLLVIIARNSVPEIRYERMQCCTKTHIDTDSGREL